MTDLGILSSFFSIQLNTHYFKFNLYETFLFYIIFFVKLFIFFKDQILLLISRKMRQYCLNEQN